MVIGNLIMTPIRALESGTKSLVEMDDTINDLNMDMMDTSKGAFTNLIASSRELSIRLGSNVSDINEMMKVYANANTTVDEIMRKTQAAAVLTNISDMSPTESVDAIQSIMLQFDQFKKSTDDTATQANHISDVLASVAQSLNLNFKTGVDSMSQAIKVSGEVMNEAGMSYEKYASIVGKTAEVSRLSGETIGNAMKTIASRISRANNGDVSAEEISKIDKAYQSIGIHIRDDSGNFKDLDTTLTALSDKWDSLNSVQRSFIAEQSAGVRQKSIFLDMMNNYTKSTEMATEALNSNGLANAKNSIYLESITAKLRVLGTEMKAIFQNGISTDAIKVVLDDTIKLVGTFGNLKTILSLITTGFAIFKGQEIVKGITSIIRSTTVFKTAIGAMELAEAGLIAKSEITGLTLTAMGNSIKALGVSIKDAFISNPIGMVAVGISAIILAMDIWGNRTEKQIEKMQQLSDKIQQENVDITALKDKLSTLDELNNKTSLSTDERDKLKQVNDELVGQYPELISYYDKESQSFQISIDKLDEVIKKKRESAMLDNANNLQSAKNMAQQAQKVIDDANAQLRDPKLISGLAYVNKDSTQEVRQQLIDDITKNQTVLEQSNSVINQGTKLINDYITEQTKLGVSQKVINAGLLQFGYTQSQINDAIKMSTDLLNENTNVVHTNTKMVEDNSKSLEEQAANLKKVEDAFGTSTNKIADLNAIMKELASGKGLSTDSLSKILTSYNELIPALGDNAKMHDLVTKSLLTEKQVQEELAKQMATAAVMNEQVLIGQTKKTISEIAKQIEAYGALSLAANGGQGSTYVDTKTQQMVLAYQDALDRINKLKGEIIKAGNTSVGKTGTTTNKTETADVEVTTDRYSQLNAELTKVNNSLDLLKQKESLANNSDKIDILNQEIAGLEQKRIALQNIQKEEEKEASELKKTLSSKGFTFDSNGEIKNYASLLNQLANSANKLSGDAKKKAVESVKALEDELKNYDDLIHTEIPNSSKEWEGVANAISEVQQSIRDVNQAMLDTAKNNAIAELEKSIYDGQSQKEYEIAAKRRIQGYQDQIDKINQIADLEKEQEERQQKLLDIQEKQNKLQNIMKEKNVQQLTQNADGGYDYTYTYDQEEATNATKDLQDAQQSYYDWEKDVAKQHQIDALQTLIDNENMQMQIRKDALDQIKADLEQALSEENLTLENHNIEVNQIVSDGLDNLKGTYGSKWDEIINVIADKVKTAQSLVSSLANLQSQADILQNSMTSGASDYLYYSPSPYHPTPYGDGGVNDYTGLAMLHGTSSSSEVIFNAADAKKLYNLVHNLPSVNTPNLTAIKNSTTPTQNNFNINKLEFPNVQDGQDVVDTLMSLPRLVLQY